MLSFRERERTGLNLRKICKREREREREGERERDIGVIKKIFLRICNKVFFSDKGKPFNITNSLQCFTQVKMMLF